MKRCKTELAFTRQTSRAPHAPALPSAAWLAVSILLIACSHASKATTPGCCEKSSLVSLDDGGADGGAVLSFAPPKPPQKFRVEEGCARDFKSSGEPGRDLAELERLCAQGLSPVLPPSEISRAAKADTAEIAFRTTGSTTCFRAGVLGIAPGQVLTLETARGVILASASSQDPIGLVPIDGTVCVREAGAYRLVVKGAPASTEARTLTVQVWQSSRD